MDYLIAFATGAVAILYWKRNEIFSGNNNNATNQISQEPKNQTEPTKERTTTTTQSTQTTNELNDLQSKLDSLTKQNRSIQTSLEESLSEKNVVSKQLEHSKKQLDQLQSSLNEEKKRFNEQATEHSKIIESLKKTAAAQSTTNSNEVDQKLNKISTENQSLKSQLENSQKKIISLEEQHKKEQQQTQNEQASKQASLSKELESSKADLKSANSQNETLTKKNNELSTANTKLQYENQQLEHRLSKHKEETEWLHSKMASLQHEINALQTQLQQAQITPPVVEKTVEPIKTIVEEPTIKNVEAVKTQEPQIEEPVKQEKSIVQETPKQEELSVTSDLASKLGDIENSLLTLTPSSSGTKKQIPEDLSVSPSTIDNALSALDQASPSVQAWNGKVSTSKRIKTTNVKKMKGLDLTQLQAQLMEEHSPNIPFSTDNNDKMEIDIPKKESGTKKNNEEPKIDVKAALRELLNAPDETSNETNETKPKEETTTTTIPNTTSPTISTPSRKPAFVSVFDEGQTEEKRRKMSLDLTNQEWKEGEKLVGSVSVLDDVNRRYKKSRGPKAKMEDFHTVIYPTPDEIGGALLCVFDGHGGEDCAKTLTTLFPQIFLAKLKAVDFKQSTPQNLRQIFIDTYHEADSKLTEFDFLGATCTTSFIWQQGGRRFIQSANVGDSLGFLKSEGKVIPLTEQHNPNKPNERQRLLDLGISLTEGQGRIGGGLAVSRAMGDHFLKLEKTGLISDPFVTDVIELSNKTRNLIVLASDGLWDVMNGEEALTQIEPLESASDMSHKLVTTALENPKCQDNITVISAAL